MPTPFWLVAALTCAQFVGLNTPAPEHNDRPTELHDEAGKPPRPAAATSKIAEVTVYKGQALVTREVAVPKGDGTVELIVRPLPAEVVDTSVFAEGSEGFRVLSTRFRSRVVKEDTRAEVRACDAELKRVRSEIQRIQQEIAVSERDLQYLQGLEGFTRSTLKGLTEKGRFKGDAILDLSRYIMDTRSARSKAQTELRERLAAETGSEAFLTRQLSELSAGSSRIEREAVVVVHRTRPEAGQVRLGYLVRSAGWTPQYRIRGTGDNAPVRLEYLAAVVQQTGEDWTGVRVTLSTAQPTLDAAPPELLPLEMAVDDSIDHGPAEANDDQSRAIRAVLDQPIAMRFANETPLEDVLKYIRTATSGPRFPSGIPTYVDPIGLQENEKTMTSPVAIDLENVPLRTTLGLVLDQLGLTYRIRDGLLSILSKNDLDTRFGDNTSILEGGMGGSGTDAGLDPGASGLNLAAATGQADELRIADGLPSEPSPPDRDAAGVSFAVAGKLDVPSRRDPQLLEIERVEMPSEYYAKAVPVLTPRFYRLAKLTNSSSMVLLPGEATVYMGTDFVGRMQIPLVAPGEPFVAGFGVDPQLQVSRRLLHKSRTVQGGNQIYTYEFRIGVRNYRKTAVKVQLWDRLPRPKGETVAVNLVTSSVDLSTDPLYMRTARMDNLLRWDLDVPGETVGDKTKYLNYEFRLEYARELPQPRFISGGLKEAPIGGGAMGMGGMGGGFRSVGTDGPTPP